MAWGTATGKSEWAAAAVDSGAANVDWAWVIADARIAPAINTASVLHVIVRSQAGEARYKSKACHNLDFRSMSRWIVDNHQKLILRLSAKVRGRRVLTRGEITSKQHPLSVLRYH